MSSENITEVVKQKYGEAALRVTSGAGSGCCGSAPASAGSCDPITSNLYDATQVGQLPDTAVLASLGCGNPTALAALKPGEVVLDLGSGGGIDVLLSAGRVGPAGKAYGLDMTDEMLALAEENKRKAGVENVEFLKGEMENIPLPDNSVDVIISNCVINLSANKDKVLAEALRVLKPGGRFLFIEHVAAQRGTWLRFLQGCVKPIWSRMGDGCHPDRETWNMLETAGFGSLAYERITAPTPIVSPQIVGVAVKAT